MDWHLIAQSVGSSYKRNGLGWVLYGLVRACKPKVCVEIGVLEGYSTIFIAAALSETFSGILYAYDLWEKYPHHHVDKRVAQGNLEKAGLLPYVDLFTADAKEVPNRIEGPIDFIHIDISNDGDTYLWAMETFAHRICPKGIMVLEGGTQERDQVDWMVEHRKYPIRRALKEVSGWDYITIPLFPGMTIMRRK
jgi:predicted O-methyltransferase YrrM